MAQKRRAVARIPRGFCQALCFYLYLGTALLLLVPSGFAEPYVEQSVIEPFSLEDQHGNTHAVDESVRVLLFSRDMDGGEVIKDALAADGETLLRRSGSVYIADISGMPWFVRKMIAKPRMRERPYLMMLDEEGDLTERFPSVEGKATLIVVDGLKVVRIAFMDSAEELREALESLPDSP